MRKKSKVRESTEGLSAGQSGKSIESAQYPKYRNERGGHGFAAEDANALSDKLRGSKVNPTGRTNELNGSDRVVTPKGGNPVAIQSKYCSTAKETVAAAFDKGIYRYKNQILEVPKDQYDEAIAEMAKKISAGRVDGISDPNKAMDLVKPGNVTYQQAKNIAKAGNIDSLVFDVKAQSIASASAFGISFVISYASCRWNGMDNMQALHFSTMSAVSSGATVLVAGVFTRQFIRTQVGRNFLAFSTKSARLVVNQIYKTDVGKSAVHKLASAIAGKALTGAAAKNVVAKLGRSTWPVAICITVTTSMPDLYKLAISRSMSWKQFSKNLTQNISGMLGGIGGTAGGMILGASVGTMIFPGVGTTIGTAVGSVLGGVGGGLGSSMLVDWIGGLMCNNDSEEMLLIIDAVVTQLSSDYLVTEDEFKKINGEISNELDRKWLERMYKAGSTGKGREDKAAFRAEYAYSKLAPIFEMIISERPPVSIPDDRDIKREARRVNRKMWFEYIKERLASFFFGSDYTDDTEGEQLA